MTPKEYTVLAMRTESKRAPLSAMDELCTAFSYSRLLHSALGCADDTGELVKIIKDCLFYGKEIDITNLKEEYGDLLWFIAQGLDALGSSFEEVMEMNIRKLRARYPDKFSDEAATERDLEAEREALDPLVGPFTAHLLRNTAYEQKPKTTEKEALQANVTELREKLRDTLNAIDKYPNEISGTKPKCREGAPELYRSVDLVTVVDLPEHAAIVIETEAYHAIMSGQAKGEIVKKGDDYVMRIRDGD